MYSALALIECWPYLVTIIAVSLIVRHGLSKGLSAIPTFGGPNDEDYVEAIRQGSLKHPESCFQIATPDIPTVIVPRRCLQAVAYSPEHKLSLGREVYERLMGRYTRMIKSDVLGNFARIAMPKNAAANIALLQQEADWAVSFKISEVHEWKEVSLFQMMINLVSLQISRSFIDSPLSHDEAWINLTLEYAISTVTIAGKMNETHKLLRPIKSFFLPDIKEMAAQFETAANLIRPVLESRLNDGDTKGYSPSDLMQYIIETCPEKRNDIKLHTRLQLEAVQAATFNLAFQLIHFFYDLLAHPNYVEPLRREAKEAFDGCNHTWTQSALASMRKCDSFLKESQRLNPIALATVSRYAMSKTPLPDGTSIPAGVSVGAPTMMINKDETLWQNPNFFDGTRFERLRAQEGNGNRYQFTSVSPSELNWGYGVHACPGRNFASYQIKILITRLLNDYDFRYPEDAPSRPANIIQGIRIMPNPEAVVLMRSRQNVG